jgi:hypothetical protein
VCKPARNNNDAWTDLATFDRSLVHSSRYRRQTDAASTGRIVGTPPRRLVPIRARRLVAVPLIAVLSMT